MHLTILKILWTITFLSFPLLGTDDVRLNIGPLHIPIFVVLLPMVPFYFYTTLSTKKVIFPIKVERSQKTFMILFSVFSLLHLANIFRSSDVERAISQQIKLFTALLVFFLISRCFPKDKHFLKKVLELIILTSTILISAYIYHSFFILHSPWLQLVWGEISRSGKNQMGFYLAIVTPLVLWRYFSGNWFSVLIIPAGIHMLAVIYSLSRGTWFSLFLSPLILLFTSKIKKPFFRFLLSITAILFIVFVPYYFYSSDKVKSEFQKRIETLQFGQSVDRGKSVSLREDFIQQGIALFSQNPVFGIGTSNYLTTIGMVAHNDYVQILSEQGIFGILVFGCMLFLVIHSIYKIKDTSWEAFGLKHSSLAIMIYLNFIYAYDLTLIYVIFGLLFSLKCTETREIPEIV